MKIDLANPAIRFLVGGANLADGCSVIRNALLRSTLVLGAVAIAAIAAVIVGFILVGTVLYAFAPWFGQIDIGLSLSYLGNSWWAEQLRAGAGVGVLAIGMAAVGGSGFLGVMLIKRLSRRVGAASHELGDRIREFPPVKALAFVGSAAYNVAHRICPKVELKMDIDPGSDIHRIMNDPEIRMHLLDSFNPERVWKVESIVPTAGHIRINVENVDDSYCTDAFFYSVKSRAFSENVVIVGEEPEESDETAVELPIDEMMVAAP